MLFDANAATAPHHDGYYLDADPEGAIVGVWIALEDIHEDAGRFFVAPSRDRARDVVGDAERASHATYLARCKTLFDARQSAIVVPALAKGDVVLWSSATLHGALPTRDPSRSRRSLNGHFLPEGARLGSWLQPHAETRGMTFHRHGDVLWNERNNVAPPPTLRQRARGLLASARARRAMK
jgi:phytanoyl-CoA hydroxylase